MGKQVRVNLTMDEEVVKKAKEMGFNLSKLCENCLKEAIRRLGGSDCSENCENNSNSIFLVRPPGFEPGSSAREADVLTRFSN